MKRRRILTTLVLALCLVFCLSQVGKAAPMGTAWTYQGRLMDANGPADGPYDLQFALFPDPINNLGQIGPPIDVNDIDITTIMLEDVIPAKWGDVQGTTLMVKFDRSEVEDYIVKIEAPQPEFDRNCLHRAHSSADCGRFCRCCDLCSWNSCCLSSAIRSV